MDKSRIFRGALTSVYRREREKSIDWGFAEGEIDKLKKSRGKPDYDAPGAPVVYAERYQLKNMNLCRSFLVSPAGARIINSKSVDSIHQDSTIRILDFGCGTMALQWAVAWVAHEKGIAFPNIEVFNFDPSSPMIEMGKCMWSELNEWIQREGDESMKGAMERFGKGGPRIWNHGGEADTESNFDLIAGIHIVYREGEVKDFSGIVHNYHPKYALLTTTAAGSKRRLIKAEKIHGYKAEDIETIKWKMWNHYNLETGWRPSISPYFARLYTIVENPNGHAAT